MISDREERHAAELRKVNLDQSVHVLSIGLLGLDQFQKSI